MSRAVVALAIAALLALSSAAVAAEPRASLPDIEDEVMCITCNVPLNIAESPQASRQRAFIRRLVDEGRTKDQIKTRLVAEYGENVLALPDEDGVGAAVYVVPIALVVLLVGGLAVMAPRWRRRRPSPAGHGPVASDVELRRLDDDLARYD